jgi:hypothetical protein
VASPLPCAGSATCAHRYDELRALATADRQRRHALFRKQRRVVVAIGLQADVGHEVLWVLRDCRSGEILPPRRLLSATVEDLKALLTEVRQSLPVPITAAISDGQDSIRKAIALALPGVPHQPCHFHYLREAARPIHEADRHGKKELKKPVRGIRKIEREAQKQQSEEAAVVPDYCCAVRSALTDDGRPPLAAWGLKLPERLIKIAARLDRVASKAGRLPRGLEKRRRLLHRSLEQTAPLWPAVRASYRWVKRVARLLENKEKQPAKQVRRGLSTLLSQDPPGSAPGQGAGRGGAVAVVREGDEELLQGAVLLLHVVGHAPNEQRPGTPVRLASLPRAACQRSPTGGTRFGGAGIGARRGAPGHATASGGRIEVTDRVCG